MFIYLDNVAQVHLVSIYMQIKLYWKDVIEWNIQFSLYYRSINNPMNTVITYILNVFSLNFKENSMRQYTIIIIINYKLMHNYI